MILRVFTAQVRKGGDAELMEVVRTRLPDAIESSRPRGVWFGRQLDAEGGLAVVIVSLWDDRASLETWTAGTLGAPQLVAGHDELIVSWKVDHYELIDALSRPIPPDAMSNAGVISLPAAGGVVEPK